MQPTTPATDPPPVEELDRLGVIEDLLLRGCNFRECRAAVSKRFASWKMSDAELAETMNRAAARLVSEPRDHAYETARALARLHSLYGRTAQIQDHKTALNVQKEINLLMNLAATTKDAAVRRMLEQL